MSATKRASEVKRGDRLFLLGVHTATVTQVCNARTAVPMIEIRSTTVRSGYPEDSTHPYLLNRRSDVFGPDERVTVLP